MAEHLLGLPIPHKHKSLKGIGPDDHHREWGWADEQGWNRHLFLPHADTWTKDANNPLIDLGGSGKFDEKGCTQPCVLRLNIGGTWYYYVYYQGIDGLNHWYDVGVARATTYDGTYTKLNNGNAIWTLAADIPPGYNAMSNPSVVYDQYETDPNKKYKAFWCGRLAADSLWDLLYAYSSDPVTGWSSFTKVWDLPNLHGVVCKWGKLYIGVFPDANDDLIIAYTQTPTSGWTSAGVKLSRGGVGAWDDDKLRFASIVYILGGYYFFYTGMGSPVAGKWFGIGLASDASYAGFGTYHKHPCNPVLERGPDGANIWDDIAILNPSLLVEEEKFIMWYAGRGDMGGTTAYRIGLATIP